MNFSGNRYTKEDLIEILNKECMDCYYINCEDKYGDYGTVGFCVVDKTQPNMTDLAFSCRVQSKRVEHTFLCFLLHHYKKNGYQCFYSTYNKTDKNEQVGKVFDEMNFIIHKSSDNKYIYKYDLINIHNAPPLMTIRWNGVIWEQ